MLQIILLLKIINLFAPELCHFPVNNIVLINGIFKQFVLLLKFAISC